MAFRFYFEQYMFERSVHEDVPKKYKERSDKILEDSGYTFRHMEKNKMFEYAEDFRTIYNKLG